MKVIDLFIVHNSNSKSFKNHEPGDVAFISNSLINNGIVGFVDPIPGEKVFKFRGICLSSFCEATVQEHPFLPRGNGGSGLVVLEPKKPLSFDELVFYAAFINKSEAWKFSYGRMIRKDRAEEIQLIDYVPSVVNIDISSIFPSKVQTRSDLPIMKRWKIFSITEIFDLKRGDFHAIDRLNPGQVVTISRIGTDNGVVGLYEPPTNVTIHDPGLITVSTVTGDAFVQFERFIATDNVVICTPKQPLRLTSLIFIQFIINSIKWRYSYGRQCYKTKFAETKIYLPVKEDGNLEELFMKSMIENTAYWDFLKKKFIFIR